MSRLTKCLFTGTLLSALLLSGCGNQAQEGTIPVASPDSAEITETSAVQSFTGKISSISGNEITLNKAQSGGTQESGMAEPDSAGKAAADGGNGVADGAAADDTGKEGTVGENGNTGDTATTGSTGDAADGSSTVGNSEAAGSTGSSTGGSETTENTSEAGSTGSSGVSGINAAEGVDGSSAGNGTAGSNSNSGFTPPALQFTDETVVITVDESTEFITQSDTAETGSSSEAAAGALTLADLQAGDILTVTLIEGTLTAARIELQSGLVAGGGGLTAAPEASASPLPLPSPGDDGKPQQSPGAKPDGQAAPPQDGKAGERPAGGPDGGPAGGAPGGGAPAGAGGGAADGAAPGSTGGAPSGASGKPAASTSTAPGASAGASSKPAASAKPAATPAAGAKPADADGGGSGGMAPGAAMSFGKIKSISGSKITLYTAEAPSAAPQDGAAPAGGPQGAVPSGRPSAEPGAGDGGQGSGGQGGRPQGQGGGQMSFSEETTVITVASDTKLISITFTDGKRTETTIALSTLKAGDIIQYTLKSGTAEAESISLSSGGPGGK
ncbi:hypothetical protein [Paenibacillus borealis]|uniref:DUF5666 domain-containing protein n=1 Tax=Paenibacillus borealis TaxID=160799 RepID=A0A089LEH8_PAEBO|nr:hypothetical protein [Paenibacillus borealis]AIQ59267.1 hypothetical protein PBOR_21705 [Paenibacillus borealis]